LYFVFCIDQQEVKTKNTTVTTTKNQTNQPSVGTIFTRSGFAKEYNPNIFNMSDDDKDLYGDLDESTTNTPTTKSKPKQLNIQQEREDIVNLNKELERVKQENEILRRNIGTLYRTSTKELQRKDDRIAELEEELARKR